MERPETLAGLLIPLLSLVASQNALVVQGSDRYISFLRSGFIPIRGHRSNFRCGMAISGPSGVYTVQWLSRRLAQTDRGETNGTRHDMVPWRLSDHEPSCKTATQAHQARQSIEHQRQSVAKRVICAARHLYSTGFSVSPGCCAVVKQR